MSTFVSVFVQDVTGRTQQQQQSFAPGPDSDRKQKLQNALLELNPPATEQSILAALVLLRDTDAPSGDPEEEILKQAVLGRVVLGVYADALNAYLDQATEAEREVEWWDNVERSRYELGWYLLQSKGFGHSPSNDAESPCSSPSQVIGSIPDCRERSSTTQHPSHALFVQTSLNTSNVPHIGRWPSLQCPHQGHVPPPASIPLDFLFTHARQEDSASLPGDIRLDGFVGPTPQVASCYPVDSHSPDRTGETGVSVKA